MKVLTRQQTVSFHNTTVIISAKFKHNALCVCTQCQNSFSSCVSLRQLLRVGVGSLLAAKRSNHVDKSSVVLQTTFGSTRLFLLFLLLVNLCTCHTCVHVTLTHGTITMQSCATTTISTSDQMRFHTELSLRGREIIISII